MEGGRGVSNEVGMADTESIYFLVTDELVTGGPQDWGGFELSEFIVRFLTGQ